MIPKEFIQTLLDFTTKQKISDIHLNTGFTPMIRNRGGEIVPIETLGVGETQLLNPLITKELIRDIIIELVGYNGMDKLMEHMELDSSYQYKERRYRINCYFDTNGMSVAIRIISDKIPTLEQLNFGEIIKKLCQKSKGLLLITGPTGAGKSTNIAAMLEYINQNFKKHIITIEDPVEYVFKSKHSLINQRELGSHTQGFPQAMKAALRADPDIIMVGEMRDPETIRAAITLAETGHLVLSTLHTNDTVQSVDRMIDVFPSGQQNQIRMQLAMSLLGVISQRLIPQKNSKQRIPAREILINNDAIRNLIITGKTHQLYSVIEVSSKSGMILMDRYLLLLYKKGQISRETLMSYARDKDGVEMLIDE